MKLRDLGIGASGSLSEQKHGVSRLQFSPECCCVTELFVKLIRPCKFDSPDVAKVYIEVDPDLKPSASLRWREPCLGVLWGFSPFPFSAYKVSNPDEKKKLIATCYEAALSELSDRFAWDHGRLAKVFAEAAERQYVLEGFWKTTWLSPDRRFRMKLRYRYDISELVFVLLLCDPRGRIKGEKIVYRTSPYIDAVRSTVKGGRWLSSPRFELQLNEIDQPNPIRIGIDDFD